MPDLPPLWTCPDCGARFVTKNMWHSCGRWTEDEHFVSVEPHLRDLYERFKEMVGVCGPFTVVPTKTRIAFMVRMRFAGCTVRKSFLRAGFILGRRLEDPRFVNIDEFSAGSFGHYFRIETSIDLEDPLQDWLCEAYSYGRQDHLTTAHPPPLPPHG